MVKRCPQCGKELKEGQKSCCGFTFDPNSSDRDGAIYKTKIECMRSRKVDPEIVFAKAIDKFLNEKWKVVGARSVVNYQSLLFGTMFYILLAREK